MVALGLLEEQEAIMSEVGMEAMETLVEMTPVEVGMEAVGMTEEVGMEVELELDEVVELEQDEAAAAAVEQDEAAAAVELVLDEAVELELELDEVVKLGLVMEEAVMALSLSKRKIQFLLAMLLVDAVPVED